MKDFQIIQSLDHRYCRCCRYWTPLKCDPPSSEIHRNPIFFVLWVLIFIKYYQKGMLTTIMNQPFWDVNMCHHVSTMVFTCVPGDATEDDATWSAVQQASWPRGPWSSVFIKNDHRVDMWYMCSIANRFFFIEADIMSIYLYYILYIYLFHISVLVEVCASGLQSDAVSMSPTMATGSSGIKSWVAADWACGAWCEPCGAPWGCWIWWWHDGHLMNLMKIWWLRWIRS